MRDAHAFRAAVAKQLGRGAGSALLLADEVALVDRVLHHAGAPTDDAPIVASLLAAPRVLSVLFANIDLLYDEQPAVADVVSALVLTAMHRLSTPET